MAPVAAQHKDVYNPLLFEIAWEVANKGLLTKDVFSRDFINKIHRLQWAVFTL